MIIKYLLWLSAGFSCLFCIWTHICFAPAGLLSRQWPEVYQLCHTFLHVARVRKHTAVWESHAKHGHARIAREARAIMRIAREAHAILTWPCVFWIAQGAKTCYKIWYLGPLPTAQRLGKNRPYADWRRLNLLVDSRRTSPETQTQIWKWLRQWPHRTPVVQCTLPTNSIRLAAAVVSNNGRRSTATAASWWCAEAEVETPLARFLRNSRLRTWWTFKLRRWHWGHGSHSQRSENCQRQCLSFNYAQSSQALERDGRYGGFQTGNTVTWLTNNHDGSLTYLILRCQLGQRCSAVALAKQK